MRGGELRAVVSYVCSGQEWESRRRDSHEGEANVKH